MDKRQKRQNKNKHHHTRAALSWQDNNELKALVASLLEIVFIEPSNPKAEWQQYVNIQELLQRIQKIEAPLRRTTSAADRLANIKAFYRWANENGIHYEGLQISKFPGYDLGLQATRDIHKDEPLFSIPRKLILSEEQLECGFVRSFFNLSNLRLAFALMVEALKPQSFWKPYIDLLPDKYNTVLYFSVDEMAQLQGSNALPQALRQCKLIARYYAIIYHWPSNQVSTQQFKDRFSYDLYRWAVSTVMTRENLIPPSLQTANDEDLQQQQQQQQEPIAALIPFWDMANHRHGSITSFFNVATQQMESSAQMDFKKGEQIFIHYGNRSNADLMIHNGFIDPTNPQDSVSIKLGLSSSDPLYEQRGDLLNLLQIPKNSELKVLPAPDYISPELLAFVRVFNMNGEQLEHWITSDRATDLLHIDCALETALEGKTWQYLQTRLMLLLRVFPTTLEADEAQLADHRSGKQPLGYIASMVLEYRILEKRILAGALDYAKQRTKA